MPCYYHFYYLAIPTSPFISRNDFYNCIVEDKGKQLQANVRQLQNNQAAIHAKDRQLQEKDRQLQVNSTQLQAKDRQLQECQHTIASRDHAVEMKERVPADTRTAVS